MKCGFSFMKIGHLFWYSEILSKVGHLLAKRGGVLFGDKMRRVLALCRAAYRSQGSSRSTQHALPARCLPWYKHRKWILNKLEPLPSLQYLSSIIGCLLKKKRHLSGCCTLDSSLDYNGIGWYWMVFIGIPKYSYWYLLVFDDICWYFLVFVDIRWFSLIFIGINWYICSYSI